MLVVVREELGAMGGSTSALEDAMGEGSVRVFFAVGNGVTVDSVSLDVALFRFWEAPIIVVNVHGIAFHVRLSSRNFLSRVAPAKAQTMLRTSFRDCRTLIVTSPAKQTFFTKLISIHSAIGAAYPSRQS